MDEKKYYTVNVGGYRVAEATSAGYHAYYSSVTSVTAIEIKVKNKKEARKIAKQFGKVLYVYE